METLIAKFKLPIIENLTILEFIVASGFKKTGNKFSVEFNGSKGYLSNITISCEGHQKENNNIIWVENLMTTKGALKKKTVSIYHSHENGVRVDV